MAVPQTRPYRRILTSALHRRFVHASALSLLVCYIVAIAIGDKSSCEYCSVRAHIRAIAADVLLFHSLLVMVSYWRMRSARCSALRLMPFHLCPARWTITPWLENNPILRPLIQIPFPSSYRPDIRLVPFFGLVVHRDLSLVLFDKRPSGIGETGQVCCILTEAPLEQRLMKHRPHERPVLNERPIYIHTFHLVLAAVQAAYHLWYDYDRVYVSTVKRASNTLDERTHPIPPTPKHIQSTLPPMLVDGLTRTVIVAGVTPIVYQLVLRHTAWSWSLYFAKLFWNFSRSSAEPSSLLPPGFLFLLVRSFFSGSLLVLCWQTANLFFSVFIGKEPLKRGQPLTSEAKDPNGSLLTGLKAKKETTKAFAFWELGLISQRLPERRKAIFNEIDREDGSTWSQVLASSTDVIKGVTARIEASKAPAPSAKPMAQAAAPQPVLQTLPRLTDAPKNENIFAASPKATSRQDKFGEAFGATAKAYGQSPDWTPKARARVRQMVDQASNAMLSPERKQKLLASSEELKLLTGGPSATHKPENLNPMVVQFLRSPVGKLVQQTYARRASSIVLGTPHSSVTVIVDAVDSLTRLLVASLAEDQYGKVQADVPSVARLFTHTITTLEAFVHQGGLDAHWTDVSFPPSSNPEAQAEARKVPEVELVLDTLKSGLGDLLTAFKPYLPDIGLVGKDLRLAKEAIGIDAEGLL